MAQNDNLNQDPFRHPVRSNNWWLYILGGLCFAGLIIWFFIDWAYKDRNREPEPQAIEDSMPAQVETQEPVDTLPAVVVDAPEEPQQ